MGGKHLGSNDEVKIAAHKWLHSQPNKLFSQGILALSKLWIMCTARHGEYVEKYFMYNFSIFSHLPYNK